MYVQTGKACISQYSNLLHNSSSLVHHLLHSWDCFHHTLLRHSSAVEVIQDSGYQRLSIHDFNTIQVRGRCKREGKKIRQQCKVIVAENMVIVCTSITSLYTIPRLPCILCNCHCFFSCHSAASCILHDLLHHLI